MKSLLQRFDKWLFEGFSDVSAEGLSAFRVLFCFYLLVFGVNGYYGRILSYSPTLYSPDKSLAVFFDLPNAGFFNILDYAILGLVVLVFFGVYTKFSSLMLGLCLIIGNTFIYSFGKISHGQLLVMLVPLVFAFSNWEKCYSYDSKRKEIGSIKSWLISLYGSLLAIAMFSAGLEKLIGGWLNWNRQAVFTIIHRSYVYEKIGDLTTFALSIHSKIFWEIADYTVVFFEMFFLVAIWKSNWMRLWVGFALMFHLAVFMFMKINFNDNVIGYLIFANWAFILSDLKVSAALKKVFEKLSLFFVLVVLVALLFIKYQFGSVFLVNHMPISKETVVYTIFFLSFIVAVGSIWRFGLKNNSQMR